MLPLGAVDGAFSVLDIAVIPTLAMPLLEPRLA